MQMPVDIPLKGGASLKSLLTCIILFVLISIRLQCQETPQQPLPQYNLVFQDFSGTWDEAIPLGNGMLGALIWQKDGKLRFSLDRADLWDLQPAANLDRPEWNFSWVRQQWEQNTYEGVQELFDLPYDRDPAPSKIPGAAMEFNVASWGPVESVELSLRDALCSVTWKNGTTLKAFIQAESPAGWFRFEGLSDSLFPELIAPAYNLDGKAGEDNPVTGQDLRRLGYPRGKITAAKNEISYEQEGWGGFKYQVHVRWQREGNMLTGCWSISAEFPGWEKQKAAQIQTAAAMENGFHDQLREHCTWWQNYWSQSAILLPDQVLTKQWYLEMYKLGAATGNGAPPVSLQAVWTADNGKLPPWKGDFHNDLNTQLSYWPAYSSNHLEQEKGFIDWLQKCKPEFEKYTRQYYRVPGLNAPGVCTLTGQPMGGWIQYAFGPTVSAWLGHHFYLHWRYSMDRDFLEKEAYPWISSVAEYLANLSETGPDGKLKLPLSSSPEIFDNTRDAWFQEMTNFDLALVRWTFEKAGELARELGKQGEAVRWDSILSKWPGFNVEASSGLTFAKGAPYDKSHRHFSHLMAYHPLGLIDYSNGKADQQIIDSTIETLDKYGSDWWCGYSYSWLGNLKARAFDGEGATAALQTFANNFCLKNSFHANGDQSGTGKSKFTYRPFTLEGNFAFAAGIQEMLIQSHTGTVHIFPAIPATWKNASFDRLRAEGAFLVSAEMTDGVIAEVNVVAEKGGSFKMINPFNNKDFRCSAAYKNNNDTLTVDTYAGQQIRFHF